jgi:uncharacterized protein involved in type VI secretion and phage assembly
VPEEPASLPAGPAEGQIKPMSFGTPRPGRDQHTTGTVCHLRETSVWKAMQNKDCLSPSIVQPLRINVLFHWQQRAYRLQSTH